MRRIRDVQVLDQGQDVCLLVWSSDFHLLHYIPLLDIPSRLNHVNSTHFYGVYPWLNKDVSMYHACRAKKMMWYCLCHKTIILR